MRKNEISNIKDRKKNIFVGAEKYRFAATTEQFNGLATNESDK